ncbi:hypothetical protein HMPREF0178_02622 [Bilophila sp. 4_1_30]|uniref:hypothetical protein n=1 Tax=Bilophila sp. 4_1_30 TaxID=693988 RepID=UPI00022389AB|nr:hypothetical protein [Bilophila sp. 4_1_30]EGW44586.1 hypothetical protein HMPREF0178_02622 [Bilophila sp. 4_1_30]
MAKKSSMPDFTFALGADLREAAAKMRKMSQPPKHQSAQQSDEAVDAMSEDAEVTVESSAVEPPIAKKETLTPEPSSDATIGVDVSPTDLPYCEESTVTIEQSEDIAAPVAPTCSVTDGLQTLQEATAEQKVVDTPEIPAESPEREHVEGTPQVDLSTLLTGGEKTEPSQGPSSESLSAEAPNAVCAPEAGSAYTLSDIQGEPSDIPVQAAQAGLDYDKKPSMTADDSYIQELTEINSKKQSFTAIPPKTIHIDTNCHQQSSMFDDRMATVNDSPVPKHNYKATTPSSDEVKKSPNVANRSIYSQLSYSQSQTVTDYQTYSSAITVSPCSSGETLLPRDSFQSRTVTPPQSTVAHSPLQDDGFKLSQAVTIVANDHKQPTDSRKVQQERDITVQHGISPSIIAATLQDAHLGGARQILLDALTALRQQSPQVVVNLKRLAPAIGLSYGTVRNTISRLVREGVICTTQVRTGDAHGVCVEFINDNPLPTMTASSRTRQSTLYQQQPQTVMKTEIPPSLSLDDTCIWNTDGDLIAILWPFAANAGFGPAHLAQLKRAYQLQGWEPENVSRCLRYLDWELANGVASGPEHVTAWLRTMQRQGHYPRPEGYVDPEVLRLRQQADEERELAEARTRFK